MASASPFDEVSKTVTSIATLGYSWMAVGMAVKETSSAEVPETSSMPAPVTATVTLTVNPPASSSSTESSILPQPSSVSMSYIVETVTVSMSPTVSVSESISVSVSVSVSTVFVTPALSSASPEVMSVQTVFVELPPVTVLVTPTNTLTRNALSPVPTSSSTTALAPGMMRVNIVEPSTTRVIFVSSAALDPLRK
ncbi:hypothetical protein GGH92_005224, partial [Coemansia sp. RSA 2673]